MKIIDGRKNDTADRAFIRTAFCMRQSKTYAPKPHHRGRQQNNQENPGRMWEILQGFHKDITGKFGKLESRLRRIIKKASLKKLHVFTTVVSSIRRIPLGIEKNPVSRGILPKFLTVKTWLTGGEGHHSQASACLRNQCIG